ncbi:30S ribosomal protein S17 [Candidatus Nomurabacteria bacterium RIFCSPLOWO2_01_FULL_36_10b]|uniref:Small ribosomal subunit protein uS17 n=1 Tax=Candidatus Nomurabacteria bacterium RIFCSPLOWO2_01_FULL_36_10b TaxID=1801766 RepID=A0A1F6WPE4_9BACT|nr:MAG: 30S ribosomal protein S17 [Candidatus Nomurabacteria bacterium RIFCSPLOWO2_01_FULL_36_10b]
MTTNIQQPITSKRKILRGIVVSNATDKTVVVKVDRFVQHPKYHKFYTKSKKYKVHDAENICQVGDNVEIESCRPMSKDKSFILARRIESNNE